MTDFGELFEYNEWANEQVLAVTDTLTPDQLRAPMVELGGSALELLSHTSRVESAFLALMLDDRSLLAEQERDYAAIRETFAGTAGGYRGHITALSRRTDEVYVPWFNRKFSVERILLQVVTHSVQHRAGVCAGIARAGKEAPNLDYIIWLNQFR